MSEEIQKAMLLKMALENDMLNSFTAAMIHKSYDKMSRNDIANLIMGSSKSTNNKNIQIKTPSTK